MSITAIFRNALTRSNYRVMLRKVVARRERDTSTEARKWAEAACEDFWTYAEAEDLELANEARAFEMAFATEAASRLAALPVRLGGGGFSGLIYFHIRQKQPEIVVETGVAAGFSTRAALLALRRNGRGLLYSSDFPYFRLPNPEQYIGVLVEEDLRSSWELFIDGDRATLPRLAERLPRIDLFHYDSDKTYSGRGFALDTIGPRLAEGAVLIMDDIQDNTFFRDMTEATGQRYRVFASENKFVGLIPAWRLPATTAG